MTLMETAQLLGNFGEFFGAIAVVFTLAYLAVQVRTAARNSAIDARQRVLDRYSDAKTNMLRSGMDGVYYGQVMRNAGAISEDDMVRFHSIAGIFADNLYNAIRLHDEGVLDEEAFEYIAHGCLVTVATPVGNQWWAEFKDAAPETMKKFIDARLEGTPKSGETHEAVS